MVLAGLCAIICKHVVGVCMCGRGGEQGRGVCSLWAWSSQLCRQSWRGSSVCPASPLREQSDGWEHSSKIRGRKTMQEEGKRSHSLGSSVCVLLTPPLLSNFLKNRQASERGRRMWLVFLPLPFLHCKFLKRPKRVNCFFKFYQQEGSPAELQFSAQRLPSCLARSFQDRK